MRRVGGRFRLPKTAAKIRELMRNMLQSCYTRHFRTFTVVWLVSMAAASPAGYLCCEPVPLWSEAGRGPLLRPGGCGAGGRVVCVCMSVCAVCRHGPVIAAGQYRPGAV